ncbi:MAG TPA: S8 family serine peptidase [Actinokineospora sp.]|nr:S8 family serine peptidase [Actinokineospora sp.]
MESARRRTAVKSAGICLLTAVVVAAFTPPLTASADPPGSGLGRHDRQLLAEAVANGKPTVTMLIATRPGASADVSRGIERLGGRIGYTDAALGYVRAAVPTARAEQAAKVTGVQAADLDETVALDDPRPEGIADPAPFPAPDASTPRANPYMPIAETGADAFMTAHPTWDGRGVTVGVLDSGITLDHPALATTTTGAPKIIDWVTYTHPFDDEDPTWVTTAQVSGPSFTAGGATYTAPAGSWRFGVFNERDPNLGGEVGSDVNRDGNPAGSSGLFGVLWDGGSAVRVDVDQDRDFTDEPVMTDYKVNRDVRYFGTDNPATAIAERMPFVVQTDGKNKVVNIGIVSGAHGSHVAGIIAANGMFGGAMTGAAPGAQLVSVRVCLFISGCTAHALIEGMIYAAKQANVDVINMSIGGLPSLNDANNTRAVLYDRLIEQENVQMYISAGNSGPGENTVGDPSVATKVMSIGTSISDATWAANYGSTAPAAGTDNQHPFSSRGPREDGGFKPNVIAPGSAISTTPVWQAGGPVAGVHVLPPGYSMFNGTSMASPQAAGAGALLVSAAKQAGVQSQPAQLRKAWNSSARFFTDYGAYEQGNGLIQVPAAWSLLATNLKTVDISSAVPVDTALEQFLATPGIGVGIHDRENVTIGQPYTRQYTFTRTSGAGGSTNYNLSLVGNDGTFSLGATSISLPKNQPRTLTVSINPSTYGAHSAILNLDDPTNPGVEYQTLNTVVVARDFTAPGYSHTITGTVARNQALSYFFEVAPGTPAFKVDFTGPSETPGTGQARFLRFHPYGVGIDSNSSLSCYSPPVPGGTGCPGGGPNSRTVSNPTPGVWELTVEARRTSDAEFTPFALTASVLGATVSPNPDLIASATVGVPVARSYTITNLLGAFTGRATGSTLGSAFIDRPTIANLAQQQRPVAVTAGTTALRATIGNPSDLAADLDLFVFNCTTGTCVLAGQSADGDSEESVTIANPAVGNWLVLVDGFAVPAGSTAYDYVDVFTNPAFGSVSITDANALRPAGASWIVPGTVTANAAPAAGRQLLGQVRVLTDANILVGSGDVIVQSVT